MNIIDTCPICNATNFEPYSMKYKAGFPHIARTKCRKCGIVFANPIASAEELLRFYANYYEKGNFEALAYKNKTRDLVKQIDATKLEKLFSFDRNLFKYATDGNFLDIGFGLGVQLYLAKKMGASKIYGTELDADAIHFVKAFIAEAIIFEGDLLGAKYPEGYFDLINFCHVIEHVLNPKLYMEELYSITKPGGILIISTPDIGALAYQLYRIINFISFKIPLIVDGLEHTFVFNKSNLQNLAIQVGYEVLEQYNESVNDSFSNIFKSNLSLKKKMVRYIQTKLKVNQVLILKKKAA